MRTLFSLKLAVCLTALLSVLLSGAMAQGLAPNTPSQEFIRLNGQVIAIENNPAGSGMNGAPVGWTSASLGGAPAGSVSFSSANANTYTLTGGGTGIVQQTADQMQVAYIPLNNDVAITAHLASFSNNSSSSLAGIVLRDTADPGAVELFVGTAGGTQAGGFFRSAPNTAAVVFDPISGSVPSWYRLQRFGDTIFTYISSDGVTWTQTGGEQRLPMHPSLVAGLIVSSGSTNATATATFDHVSVDSYPPFFSLASFMAGDYFFLTNAATGKVLDVPGFNTNDGSTLDEWGLNSGTGQQWALLMRADGLFTIQNNNSSLVLSLSGNTVIQSSQQWRDDQAFTLRSNDGATVSLINKASGLALVFNGSIDSQPLEQASYDPTQANQRWALTPAGYFKMFLPYTAVVTSPNTPGTLTGSVSMAVSGYGYGAYGLQAYNSNYADSPQILLNGQSVVTFPPGTYSGGFSVANVTEGAQLVTTEASQGFVLESETLHIFQALSGTRYYIKNLHSGLYLRWNAAGAYTDQIASGGAEIQWTFVPLGNNTFHVINQATGGMLEVPNASTSGGGSLTVSGSTNGSEVWTISPLNQHNFELVNNNSGLVMEVVGPYNPGTPSSDGTINSGQTVDQWPYYGGEAQQWVLQPAP